MVGELSAGAVVWAELGPGVGGEQSGRRPVVVVSSEYHVELVERLVTVVACTSRDRGWPNHVLLTGATGLGRATFAMTEQMRTIDRSRIVATAGEIDDTCLAGIAMWLGDWLV